ncbi:hypothetical protein [Chroococcidiopsis sp. SAG 2025]|uniref:hypothetical protein n=1 Tax=Chroococcidiopsis sp. SAG 2025 TaxID=171389 RepID=UPI00293724F4|nr:hypothetical protein [Chroococcidiopsis sp. SAG 2025]
MESTSLYPLAFCYDGSSTLRLFYPAIFHLIRLRLPDWVLVAFGYQDGSVIGLMR